MATVGMRAVPASSTHIDAARIARAPRSGIRFAVVFLLLMSAPLADELPRAMITLPASELAAMKARNDELWFDNHDLVRELNRVNALLEQQERLLDSSCGRWIKA